MACPPLPGEAATREAVWWSAAHLKRTAQEPGTPSSLPTKPPAMRGAGDQTPTRLEFAGALGEGERKSASRTGSPKARETGAEDEGDREPEGCVVVMTPGNG